MISHEGRRVTDFGIPALKGRPVGVLAATYYGAAIARLSLEHGVRLGAIYAYYQYPKVRADRRHPFTTTKETLMDKEAVLKTLNRIMELELAGVVRYTHYALMVYGYNRIPIVAWLKKNADEGLQHARQAGELVTWLGGHPSLGIGPLLESHKHDIGDILRESLDQEAESLKAYYDLLGLVKDQNIRLDEYARDMISEELAHQDEVNKMLRKPGQTETFVV